MFVISRQPAEVHFGLGEAKRATAEIRWPGGAVQKVAHLKLNTVNDVRRDDLAQR